MPFSSPGRVLRERTPPDMARIVSRTQRGALTRFKDAMKAAVEGGMAPAETGALRRAHRYTIEETREGVRLRAGWAVGSLEHVEWTPPTGWMDESDEAAEGFTLLAPEGFDYGEYQYRGRRCPKGQPKVQLNLGGARDHWLARFGEERAALLEGYMDEAMFEAFDELWGMA